MHSRGTVHGVRRHDRDRRANRLSRRKALSLPLLGDRDGGSAGRDRALFPDRRRAGHDADSACLRFRLHPARRRLARGGLQQPAARGCRGDGRRPLVPQHRLHDRAALLGELCRDHRLRRHPAAAMVVVGRARHRCRHGRRRLHRAWPRTRPQGRPGEPDFRPLFQRRGRLRSFPRRAQSRPSHLGRDARRPGELALRQVDLPLRGTRAARRIPAWLEQRGEAAHPQGWGKSGRSATKFFRVMR